MGGIASKEEENFVRPTNMKKIYDCNIYCLCNPAEGANILSTGKSMRVKLSCELEKMHQQL